MKAFAVLAVMAAWSSLASAHFTVTNGTHFVDELTGHHIQHFGCPVHRGHGSHHFNQTVERLHAVNKQRKHRLHAGPHHTGHLTRRAAKKQSKHKKPAAHPSTSLSRQTVQTPILINTHFHIVATTANSGLVTQPMISAQLAAMNTAYNPYGISFNLASTTSTTNDDWSIAATTSDAAAMKIALRTGSYADLNIYFHTDLAGGNLGTCTLPAQVPPGAVPAIYASDGCDVNANTMPGGSMSGYNMGGTAIHETGHWLGLLHTFEGYSCDGDGDMIDDTPMEMQSTDGCPAKPPKDSCPTATGVDPIHNYMDYSTDACYEEFTPLQIARIDALWKQFRLGQ